MPDSHQTAAFAKDDRPQSDYEQHTIRKAREVLAFTGIGEGMTVIDMEAGGGVYTEFFSKTVGNAGKVHMQNPPLFDGFAGDAIKARVTDGRLPNVVQMRTAFGHFVALDHQAAPGSPPETGGTTHRIDRGIAIERAEAAGLALVEKSDMLASSEDDYAKNVFDPSVRRKTDRFLLKFEKQ